ncbi:MAG: TIGR02300 family protein [Pseudomonadota bacterium]|nr:TIGR02300 family protein [Pseudomonadota bacterium]
MTRPEWGTKRICPDCATRYYDLNKKPPRCPKCGTAFDPEALLRSRRGRSSLLDEKPVAAEPVEEAEALVETAEEVPAAGGDDEVLIEDTSELGEEEVEEVVEHGEDEES